MAILGQVPLRRHLFGRQASFASPVPAVRAYPLSGVPVPNLNLIRPDADQGALYPVVKRYKGPPDLNFTLNHNALCYNDLPLIFAAFFGGAVTPIGAGTAKTWDWSPDPFVADDIDPFSYEFGDDADGTGGNPNDWMQYVQGVLTGFTIDSPETGAGVLTANLPFKFGDIFYAGSTDISPATSIPSITDRPDKSPTPLYLKDAKVFMDSDASDIGGTQLSNAVHTFTLTASQELDEKRYVNGSQTFELDAYGRGPVTIEMALVYAKTADTVGVGSESDAWSANDPVDRFISVVFESVSEAESGIPYSWTFSLPAWYFQREETNIGNNTTVTLTAEAHVDDILASAFNTQVVNTLASADL
jgi:hypothetical protein